MSKHLTDIIRHTSHQNLTQLKATIRSAIDERANTKLVDTRKIEAKNLLVKTK